jgi:hypothetical protein
MHARVISLKGRGAQARTEGGRKEKREPQEGKR